MLYLTYTPRPPLSQFVESFWYAENAAAHAYERLLPNGDIDIVLNLRGELRFYDPDSLRARRLAGLVASGAHSDYYVIDTAQQASLLGVRFRPGGAYPLLGDTAEQLQNRQVALEDLWGRRAVELQARLVEAETHEARFLELERAFLARLSRPVRGHPAIAEAASVFAAREGDASVGAAAAAAGLSPRRFIELFRREIGQPPKTFCRVLRFQRALRLLASSPRPALARLALACGYADQAHLNRDFKAFSGITPTAYLSRPRPHFNHVPLAAGGQIRPIPAGGEPAE